ncbi:hypothetical protein GN956_G9781 [Arapaima gigas]
MRSHNSEAALLFAVPASSKPCQWFRPTSGFKKCFPQTKALRGGTIFSTAGGAGVLHDYSKFEQGRKWQKEGWAKKSGFLPSLKDAVHRADHLIPLHSPGFPNNPSADAAIAFQRGEVLRRNPAALTRRLNIAAGTGRQTHKGTRSNTNCFPLFSKLLFSSGGKRSPKERVFKSSPASLQNSNKPPPYGCVSLLVKEPGVTAGDRCPGDSERECVRRGGGSLGWGAATGELCTSSRRKQQQRVAQTLGCFKCTEDAGTVQRPNVKEQDLAASGMLGRQTE